MKTQFITLHRLVAHLLISGGVIAFCTQHTDTRPANERAFYWTNYYTERREQ